MGRTSDAIAGIQKLRVKDPIPPSTDARNNLAKLEGLQNNVPAKIDQHPFEAVGLNTVGRLCQTPDGFTETPYNF